MNNKKIKLNNEKWIDGKRLNLEIKETPPALKLELETAVMITLALAN